MKITRLSLLFIISACLLFTTESISQSTPKFVNEFLNIGVGARGHGMAGSVGATTFGATSGYWNPSGLVNMESDYQAAAMHASWFGGIANYDYLSVAGKFGDYANPSAGAISLIRMGIDNIPNTLQIIEPDGTVNYDNITEFSAADYALLLSYAMPIGDSGLSFGTNAKVIFRNVGSFARAWGVGFDAGLMYKKDQFSIGIMGRDITTTVNAWSFDFTEEDKLVFTQTGNVIPSTSTEIALPKISLAGAYFGEAGKFSYLGELDLNFSTDGTKAGLFTTNSLAFEPSLGLEFGYNQLVFVRFGLGNFQNRVRIENTSERDLVVLPNVGIGIVLGRIKVDYALANIGNTSESLVSHIISLSFDF